MLLRQVQRPNWRIERRGQAKPPRYKVFLLTWLAIYPLITGIMLLLGDWLNRLPLLLRTLLLTGLLVYLMTYVVMPKLMKVFDSWLFKGY